MRLIAGLLLLCLASTPALAEVVKSSDDGFIIRLGTTVANDRASVFETMTGEVGQWWNSDHSYSGDAGNLHIDKQCFCERWDGNVVRHMSTAMWMEGSRIILEGGLGPLMQNGLSGTMVWSLASGNDAGTSISWTYNVYGYSDTDMNALAEAVDGVLAEQLGRLAQVLNSKNPAGHSD